VKVEELVGDDVVLQFFLQLSSEVSKVRRPVVEYDAHFLAEQ